MPDEPSHLKLANHNQELLNKLIPDVEQFPDWVAVIAFYKALHVVEAVFASEKTVRHGADHGQREHLLKCDRRYLKIYEHYRPLFSASMVARYMKDDGADFASVIKPQQVIADLLKHRLHQVEKSAAKWLKHPNDLITVESGFATTGPIEPS